ncbi:MAG: translation initiation factor IF-2 [Gemmatimonadetes bacterium]|nr:MAG: translation initiation factor IF-2 [Gemmatimonadota bacterium]
MRVLDLAADLGVSPEVVLGLLRTMQIAVAGAEAEVSEADVARVLARVERERRAGHEDVSEAIEAAIQDARPTAGRRRRRRRSEPEPAEAPEAEAGDDAVVSDQPEAAEGEAGDAGSADEASAEPAGGGKIEASAEPEPAGEEAAPEAPEVEDATDEDEPSVEAPEAEAGAGGEASSEAGEPEADEAVTEAPADEAQEPVTPMPARAAAPPTPVRGTTSEGGRRIVRRPTPAASAGPGGQVRIQAEGYTPDGRRKRKKDKKKRQRVDRDAVQENISRVMAELKGGGKKRRRRHSGPSREELEAQEEEARQQEERERRTVRVNEFLTVAELAELVDVSPTEIVGSAFKNLGLMVTINQRLDFDQIELLLDEFGFEAVREEEYAAPELEVEEEDDPESLVPRPPVVTVMGHVDHGKTLLLDRIRDTNVVAGEAGGITQHIGAYHVELDDGRSLTFLDTPGHAAFTAMRARGADVTDIVILVVAADDSVMPQTKEAISHARNAGVPIVVAINKCDLPAADPNRVKQELLQHDVQVEDFGGDVLVAEISAKTGQGIEDLLEKVLLQAELLELKANPDREARGTVIEAQLDVGKGPVVSVLVQKGTLRVGDSFVVGNYDGRVRAMLDERGQNVEEAGPSIPVQLLGAGGVPQAGDTLQVMDAVKAAEIAQARQRLEREKQLRIKERGFKLGDFSALLEEGKASALPLVIKADVDGSVQAVSDALEQLSTDEVQVQIVHRGVGAINESDVLLASTAGAVVIGFRVRPDTGARQLAEREDVDVRTYDVIYDAVDEVRAALEGMLSPERREEVIGAAEVREIFKITKVGTIAGCYVVEGVIDRKGHARLIRDGIVIYDGEFSSLKRFKDDVKEVREGFECGIGIANYNDIKVGDLIECYRVEEVARTLAGSGSAS